MMRQGWSGALRWCALGCACAIPLSASRAATEVPLALKDAVETYMSSLFVRPETNNWHFDDLRPFLGADRVVCGRVDFQSLGQKYVGLHHFYAIIHDGNVTMAQMEDAEEDPGGARQAKMKALCGF